MDFACFLFANSANFHLNKLDKIQNQALRVIGGFIKSSPIHAMESELSISPLSIRRRYLGFKFILKSFSLSNNITTELLQAFSTEIGYWDNRRKPLLIETFNKVKQLTIHSANPLEMFSLDVWVSRIGIRDIVKFELKSVKYPKRNYEVNVLRSDVIQELHSLYIDWFKLFTDGSKSDLKRGAAFYDPDQEFASCYKINEDVSIMTLELIAISQALSHAITLEKNKVVIFSDSKSALQHLARCASAFRGVPIAYEVLKKVHIMSQRGIQLRLQWVPSHIGIRGNELVDKWAKFASNDGTPIEIRPHYSELTPKFKIMCFNFWKEFFDLRSREKGIWYKTIQCEPLQIPWFSSAKIKRSLIKSLCRLRSGHYPSNKFAHLMQKVRSPNCDVCGSVDDLTHMLLECKKNEMERRSLMVRFNLNKLDVGLFQSALASPTSELALSLCPLVTACHR